MQTRAMLTFCQMRSKQGPVPPFSKHLLSTRCAGPCSLPDTLPNVWPPTSVRQRRSPPPCRCRYGSTERLGFPRVTERWRNRARTWARYCHELTCLHVPACAPRPAWPDLPVPRGLRTSRAGHIPLAFALLTSPSGQFKWHPGGLCGAFKPGQPLVTHSCSFSLGPSVSMQRSNDF